MVLGGEGAGLGMELKVGDMRFRAQGLGPRVEANV